MRSLWLGESRRRPMPGPDRSYPKSMIARAITLGSSQRYTGRSRRSSRPGKPMANESLLQRFGSPLLAALLAVTPALGQIATNGTVRPKVSLSGPNVNIGKDRDTQRGDSLFHSFEKWRAKARIN
jgi:hypothetical protein